MNVRFDRLVTTRIVHPLIRARQFLDYGNGEKSRPLPILMYHSISNDHEPGVSPYYRTVTTPSRFAEQMHFLKDTGWQGVNLSDGLNGLRLRQTSLDRPSNSSALDTQRSTVTSKQVVLTFDDGLGDFHSNAFPILQSLGFNATMYLPTGFLGERDRPFRLHGRDCLTWSQVSELHAAGVEFGSHTVNHPKLTDLSWAQIKSELCDSKHSIEQHLSSTVKSFAYPYAFPQSNKVFVSRFEALLKQSRYQTCVTTEIGRAANASLFRLKRLPVNDADDLKLFAAKLDGAYDCLAFPQLLTKRIAAHCRER